MRMQEELLDVFLHAVVFVGYTLASAVFAGVGALFEYKGYLSLNSGETFVAVWIGILGAVLLGMAYLIISDKATVAYEDLRTRV